MKTLYIILCNSGVDSNTVNELLQNRLPDTAFPGCWSLNTEVTEETKEYVLRSISIAINHSIKSPEFKHIIICLGSHEQSVIAEILSRIETIECDVRIININDLEKLIIDNKI